MKIISYLLCLILFIVSFIIITPKAALAVDYTLDGHIYNSGGTPVANQQVMINAGIFSATTDEFGFYSMQVSPGNYNIDIHGYSNPPTTNLPQWYEAGNLEANPISITQDKTIDFTVPATQVTLHVQDTNGTAVQGATVATTNPSDHNISIDGSAGNGGSLYYKNYVTTDEFGNVTLWLFPNDSGSPYYFTVYPPIGSNLQPTVSTVNVTSNNQVTVIIPQPVTLRGYIYNFQGTAVAGQTVQLSAGGQAGLDSATTDENGFYSMQVSPGNYSVEIHADNNSPTTNLPQWYEVGNLDADPLIITQDTDLNVTVPARQVTVHVLDMNQNPLVGATISTNDPPDRNITVGGLAGSGVSSYFKNDVTTDESGDVTLWLFPNDSGSPYSFTIYPPVGSNLSDLTKNIDITGEQTVNILYNEPPVNEPPVINPLTSPVYINNGDRYFENSWFTDPDSTSWTATVDYGDGSGSQNLVLADKHFSVDHVYNTAGSFNVVVTVTDNQGASGTANATVNVNQKPVVNPISSSTINIGTYTANGSFSDPDNGPWTGTANYGDGTGTYSLSISGNNFTLNHTYTNVGIYNVIVTITDSRNASGTTTPTITVQRQLVSLAPTNVWIGLGANKDSGIKFDIRSEVYANGTLVSTGQVNSVSGGSSTQFSGAVLSAIPFSSFSALNFPTNSTLNIKIFVRNACSGSTKTSGSAKLWYNSSAANSRFGATIGTNSSSYYLSTSSSLLTSPGTAQTSTSVAVGAQCGPFVQLGSWSKTI